MLKLSAKARFGSSSGKNLGLLMRRANSEYVCMHVCMYVCLEPRLVGVFRTYILKNTIVCCFSVCMLGVRWSVCMYVRA